MKLKLALATTALISLCSTGAFAAGDADKGQPLYAVCGSCHGAQGEGNQSLNAPRLAGQEDWYIVRQLQNFKTGVRGSNPQDTYGMQMAPMAQILPNDQAIEDVAAYIAAFGE